MKRSLSAAIVLAVLVPLVSVSAQTIKLGSVAPSGSPWDRGLRQLAADWDRISGGKVKLKVYMGGIVGDEPDMLRKMRIGQLQAAALTGLGLNHVSPEILAISVPFLVRNDGELDYLLDRTRPFFMELLEEQGFKVLALSKAGWVNFFSREPVHYPDDLRSQKLAVHDGDTAILEAWRSLGFDAVPLSLPDLMVGLQTGMAEAFYAPPLVSAGYQWFGIANHMTSMRVAPVVGGIVVSTRVWSRIPQDLRAELEEAVRDIDRDLYEETVRLEAKALGVMVRHGLIVDQVPPDAETAWHEETAQGFKLVVGKTFSQSTYDLIAKILEEYRKEHADE